MTKNYYTVNGRIIGESTGGVRTNYLPDALGSVTATVDESGAVVNTYRYKPYGSQLSKSGAGADPKFLWRGQAGYRTEIQDLVSTDKRTLNTKTGTSLTVSKAWPDGDAYNFDITGSSDPNLSSLQRNWEWWLFKSECERPIPYECEDGCRQITGKKFDCCNSRYITLTSGRKVFVCCQRICEEIKCFDKDKCNAQSSCKNGFRISAGVAHGYSRCRGDVGLCTGGIPT